MSLNLLALDLGAESGRAILGRFDGARITLEEIHRFANEGVRVNDSLHWDTARLWSEIKHALACAPRDVASIGLDTWGVDFGLLDQNDQLIDAPFHYRDARTDGMMDAALRVTSREEIFEQTGIQFMPINTLYQLLAMRRANAPALASAQTFLMMPDLFNFWLTGRKASEFTIASTSQCYDPRAHRWATPLLERLEIPTRIFPDIIPPATILGSLAPSVADETGLRDARVIAPACHDTAAAVAAVPVSQDDFVYLSSGTWSLMGVETRAPIITPASLANNFTNEGGVAGTFRFLKNIMGLWLIQECRRAWARAGQTFSYDDLTQLAAIAPRFVALIDPDDTRFLHPADMPAQIQAYCADTRQTIPQTHGEIARCIFEGLALKYRWTLERIEEMTGQHANAIHIVGGGAQNKMLCQFTADATARPVIAGPIEATASGNVLMQALALGHLGSIADARQVVRASFPLATYEPRETPVWDEAYARFRKIASTNK
ncbi:MAG: rhamnulokinase [Chloroflexi bacterium]|nr:rhamnulokinase [Chloroflexota bacterium]